MTDYFWIQAEVAGGLGPESDYDVTRRPRLVGELHYMFDDWMGDDIVTTAGFWCVTERLAEHLSGSRLSGWRLDSVKVSVSEMWRQLHSAKELPSWRRLVVTGNRETGDDFWIAHDTYLAVSARALVFLRRFALQNAVISPAHDDSDTPPVSAAMAHFLKMHGGDRS